MTAGAIARKPLPRALAVPRQAAAMPRPMPESSFDKPDCSGCRLRELVFFLPVLLEARERVEALLRLREGEDVRVAMRPT